RRDGGTEFRQQIRRLFQIGQAHDLDRAVHVAVGNADKAGGNAVPADLDDIGVGAGGARRAADLYRDVAGAGGFFQPLQYPRVDVWPAENHRAAAQPRVAELLLVVAGRIRGVANVHGDADGGVDAVGAGHRAAQADFFLDRGDTEDGGLERPAVQQPQRFHDRPDADLVVQGG